MSLTIEDSVFTNEDRTLVITILSSELSVEEREKIGIDGIFSYGWVLFYVEEVCEKLNIAEDELFKRLDDLYIKSVDENNINMRLVVVLSEVYKTDINNEKLAAVLMPCARFIKGAN